MKISKLRSLVKSALVVAVSIIFILAALEITLRLFLPQNLNYTTFDKNYMFRHIPNLEFRYFWKEFDNIVKFNSKGFRDYEYDYEKKNNAYRILILGDSLPAALQVSLNETFPKILEQKLMANGKKDYEVINTGVGGYGTENELLFVEFEGAKYNPDMVILAFAMSDFDEDLASPLITIEDNKIVRQIPVKQSIPKGFLLYCSRYSHLCAWTHSVVLRNLQESDFLRKIFAALRISSKGDSVKTETKSGLNIYMKRDSEIFRKAVNGTFLTILELKSILDKGNTKLVILAMPQVEQVDSKFYKDFLAQNKLSEKDVEIGKFQRLAEKFAKNSNVTLINPLEYLKEKNANNSFYFNIGGHFSRNGHRIMAEYIYNELKRQKLLD